MKSEPEWSNRVGVYAARIVDTDVTIKVNGITYTHEGMGYRDVMKNNNGYVVINGESQNNGTVRMHDGVVSFNMNGAAEKLLNGTLNGHCNKGK